MVPPIDTNIGLVIQYQNINLQKRRRRRRRRPIDEEEYCPSGREASPEEHQEHPVGNSQTIPVAEYSLQTDDVLHQGILD